MDNKFNVIVVSIIFWIFLGIFSLYLNFAGYSSINTDIINTMSKENFNLLTMDGLETGLDFLLGLSKYTITGLGIVESGIILTLGLINLVAFIYFVRGGG